MDELSLLRPRGLWQFGTEQSTGYSPFEARHGRPLIMLQLQSAATAPEVGTQETGSLRSVSPFVVCDVLRHVVHGSVWAHAGWVEVFYSNTLGCFSLAKAIESCPDVDHARL